MSESPDVNDAPAQEAEVDTSNTQTDAPEGGEGEGGGEEEDGAA